MNYIYRFLLLSLTSIWVSDVTYGVKICYLLKQNLNGVNEVCEYKMSRSRYQFLLVDVSVNSCIKLSLTL
jgi:hypothetical protein